MKTDSTVNMPAFGTHCWLSHVLVRKCVTEREVARVASPIVLVRGFHGLCGTWCRKELHLWTWQFRIVSLMVLSHAQFDLVHHIREFRPDIGEVVDHVEKHPPLKRNVGRVLDVLLP